jgi:hypothetical protein
VDAIDNPPLYGSCTDTYAVFKDFTPGASDCCNDGGYQNPSLSTDATWYQGRYYWVYCTYGCAPYIWGISTGGGGAQASIVENLGAKVKVFVPQEVAIGVVVEVSVEDDCTNSTNVQRTLVENPWTGVGTGGTEFSGPPEAPEDYGDGWDTGGSGGLSSGRSDEPDVTVLDMNATDNLITGEGPPPDDTEIPWPPETYQHPQPGLIDYYIEKMAEENVLVPGWQFT